MRDKSQLTGRAGNPRNSGLFGIRSRKLTLGVGPNDTKRKGEGLHDCYSEPCWSDRLTLEPDMDHRLNIDEYGSNLIAEGRVTP